MDQNQSNPNSSVRRCGQVGEGDDSQLTLMDALDEVERLEADADAVLGGSDAYNCTYPQGYLKRQAVYACVTCTPEGNAGICLACSYACHEGHDLLELYTKRHFKCDCGNEKFKENKCQLFKDRKELNSRNRYNQNFRGFYCTCSRPYPDEDDSVEDEMIQCIICEDWHHGRHLQTEVPDNSDYHEMICTGCMCKYPFLWAYHVQCELTSEIQPDGGEVKEDVDIINTSSELKEDEKVNKPKQSNNSSHIEGTGTKSEVGECSTSQAECNKNKPVSCVTVSSPSKRKTNTTGDEREEVPVSKKIKTEDRFLDKNDNLKPQLEEQRTAETPKTGNCECLLKTLQKRVVHQSDCAVFWSEGWRSKLCRCSECLEMYQDRNIEFLIDDSDTMQAYEAKGIEAKKNATAAEEDEAAAFASLGRVQQIEVAQGIMDFKSELNDFLKGFAEEGKVVKESDVREFFERMRERKRNRMHLPQHNCR
ncbi:hypothetical protein EGW08_017414 [Elysia chlorotica]|uniref:UBR-type domain-containing protein n=1 Tax=Elysia chlorotica TaxID=188477 RepID=A0A433SZT9_ELYCH|nr:hypothetical protein EGW08_017414 [Elysia chlorotica]